MPAKSAFKVERVAAMQVKHYLGRQHGNKLEGFWTLNTASSCKFQLVLPSVFGLNRA